MHQHNWRAVYKDGTHLDRYTHDGKPNGYENIKRDQLVAFELWDHRVNKRVVRVNMERRCRLIYRARTYLDEQSKIVGREYLIGWQEIVNGKNVQTNCLIRPDNSIELFGRWKHPPYDMPPLRKEEKEEME